MHRALPHHRQLRLRGLSLQPQLARLLLLQKQLSLRLRRRVPTAPADRPLHCGLRLRLCRLASLSRCTGCDLLKGVRLAQTR